MKKPLEITKPHILIVEGIDEVHFFTAMGTDLGLDIQILPANGKDGIKSLLQALPYTTGYTNVRSLGVVRDADKDPKAAWDSIRGALKSSNLPCPSEPLTVAKGDPKVVVMIMPSSNREGMLETLCFESVRDDPAYPLVINYFNNLQKAIEVMPCNMDKARIHAYLASREIPDLMLGIAADKGYWPLSDSAFNECREFLLLLSEQRVEVLVS